jgi:hypothetical protein
VIFFIDTEFNEFRGELISLALFSITGHHFYEVLECKNPGPWVKENVIPVLNKDPIPYQEFQKKLQSFINRWDDIHIIADWPEDLQHFNSVLINGPGTTIQTPVRITMEFNRLLTCESKLPHNALADAVAIAKSYHSINH